jgi:hypothetical protein
MPFGARAIATREGCSPKSWRIRLALLIFVVVVGLVTWAFIEPSPPGLILQCLFLYWLGRDLSLFNTNTNTNEN